jgi:hypothetical protein
MKTKRLLLLSFTLCFLLAQTAVAQAAPASPPNADPERVRDIVQALANKSGVQAVLLGMWVNNREVLTMALGESMTTVPATTDMHYRTGDRGNVYVHTRSLSRGSSASSLRYTTSAPASARVADPAECRRSS